MAIKDEAVNSAAWERKVLSHWIGVFMDLLEEGDEGAQTVAALLAGYWEVDE